MNRQRMVDRTTITRQLRMSSQVHRKRYAGRESMRKLKGRHVGPATGMQMEIPASPMGKPEGLTEYIIRKKHVKTSHHMV